MSPSDDAIARLLVDRAAAGDARTGGPCPDDQALAALAEGRLPASERDAVAAHVAGCDVCAVVVATVANAVPLGEEAPGETGAPLPSLDEARSRRPTRWLPFAAAAAVLAVAGWFVSRPSPGPGGDATWRDLEVAAAGLARARPELVGDLPLLSAKELAAGGYGVLRGGLYLHGPSESVIEARPAFAWDAVPGAASYEVALYDATGARLWVRTSNEAGLAFSADAAPLAPAASYRWSASAQGALGPVEGSRAFSRASEAEAARWAAIEFEAATRVPAESRHLLLAHLALRRGHLAEAERHVAEQRKAGDSDLARATEAHVRRRLGHRDTVTPGR